MKKYKADEWVYYCRLPDVEYFKDERIIISIFIKSSGDISVFKYI